MRIKRPKIDEHVSDNFVVGGGRRTRISFRNVRVYVEEPSSWSTDNERRSREDTANTRCYGFFNLNERPDSAVIIRHLHNAKSPGMFVISVRAANTVQ